MASGLVGTDGILSQSGEEEALLATEFHDDYQEGVSQTGWLSGSTFSVRAA